MSKRRFADTLALTLTLVVSSASWAIAQDTLVLDCAGEATMVGISKGGNWTPFPVRAVKDVWIIELTRRVAHTVDQPGNVVGVVVTNQGFTMNASGSTNSNVKSHTLDVRINRLDGSYSYHAETEGINGVGQIIQHTGKCVTAKSSPVLILNY